MKLFQNPILFLAVFFFAGCKEAYDPKIQSTEQSVLIVDGMINSGDGPTTIRLSRSSGLDAAAQPQAEIDAQVAVESEAGVALPLYQQTVAGDYTSNQLNLDPTSKYRVHIITGTGDEYASDYVPVLNNPPIDSINWKRDANGIAIYVNTHSAGNDVNYYRWEYEETWERRAGYFSRYKMVEGQPVGRAPGEDVYTCWRQFNSSNIFLFSSAQLASSVVFERPLIKIPDGSDKLSVRYSVLVRQFALTKQGYEFYQLMKKNTESLGSLFDAQPSEIGGNIHALSGTGGRVIGFITAAPAQEKRIFITREEVPGWNFTQYCATSIEVKNDPDSIKKYLASGNYAPYDAHIEQRILVGYFASYPECTDCTFTGGSTLRPWFW